MAVLPSGIRVALLLAAIVLAFVHNSLKLALFQRLINA